jgi:hypothetical protein
MEDRGWKIEDGRSRMEDGRWRMENGRSRMEDRGWRVAMRWSLKRATILDPPSSILPSMADSGKVIPILGQPGILRITNNG